MSDSERNNEKCAIVSPQEDDLDEEVCPRLKAVPTLAELFTLVNIGRDRYAGPPFSKWYTTRTFGGVTMAQAILAAEKTVAEGRFIHSFHAYYLRAGNADAALIYQVKRLRDGQSFSNRRVQVFQNGQLIFELMCSFQVKSTLASTEHPPFVHQYPRRTTAQPEESKPYADKLKFITVPGDLRHVLVDRSPDRPRLVHWLRADLHNLGPLDRPIAHCAAAAFLSDLMLLSVATLPHLREVADRRHLQSATLCHSMWFHQDFRADQWLLHEMISTNASNERGLCIGHMYTKEGVMVATCVQEGLVRHDPSKSVSLMKRPTAAPTDAPPDKPLLSKL